MRSLLELTTTLYNQCHDGLAQCAYAYRGPMNHALMHTLADSCQRSLTPLDIPFKLRKRAYHISIEMLQNVLRHAASDKESWGYCWSTFMMSYDPQMIQLLTANCIRNEAIEKFSKWLECLNECTPGELKSLFMAQLSEGTLSAKGGAGLGLIDIIRKSGEKLEYRFEQSGEGMSQFFLCVRIPLQ